MNNQEQTNMDLVHPILVTIPDKRKKYDYKMSKVVLIVVMENCGFCGLLKKGILPAQVEYNGKVVFKYEDSSNADAIKTKYNIAIPGYPTSIFLKNDVMVFTLTGWDYNAFMTDLEKLLDS
jgi:hypothetical protein